MMAILIGDLTRKLGLLKTFGGFPNATALAEAFGVSRTTMYKWGHGRGERGDAGQLPDHHMPMMLEIAGRCLGEAYDPARVRELISAPFAELEAALKTGSQPGLSWLIENEALPNRIRLIPASAAGLAETDLKPPPEPDDRIGLNEWFRLEAKTSIRSPQAFALQNVGQRWGIYPAHVDLGQSIVLMPGRKHPGDYAHIIERQQKGSHRFIILQCPELPPHDIMRYFHESLDLDMAALGRIVAFYSSQNPSRRALFVTDIQID